MQKTLEIVATIAGILGVLVCLAAGVTRISGNFYLAGFEAMTLFSGGMGLMLFAVLAKLELIHSSLNRPS